MAYVVTFVRDCKIETNDWRPRTLFACLHAQLEESRRGASWQMRKVGAFEMAGRRWKSADQIETEHRVSSGVSGSLFMSLSCECELLAPPVFLVCDIFILAPPAQNIIRRDFYICADVFKGHNALNYIYSVRLLSQKSRRARNGVGPADSSLSIIWSTLTRIAPGPIYN